MAYKEAYRIEWPTAIFSKLKWAEIYPNGSLGDHGSFEEAYRVEFPAISLTPHAPAPPGGPKAKLIMMF